jgi:MATE family multidrug resistance protein
MNFLTHIKKNLSISFPVVISQIAQSAMTIVNNIMIGSLGSISLGAIGLANSVFFIVMIFGIGLSSSISPLFAQEDALQNKKEVMAILQHGLVISFFLSLFMYLVTRMLICIFPYLNQPKDVVNQAISFLKILSISLIPHSFYEMLRKFAEGLSLTTPVMFVTWIAMIVNIILNYLFFYGRCGCPKLGIVGAAYAILIVRIILLITLSLILKKNQKIQEYYKEFNFTNFHRRYFKKIFYVGVPTSLQIFFEVGTFTAATFIVGLSDKNQLAAHHISINIVSITYMICISLSIAATIRISNQKNLKNYMEIRKVSLSVFFIVGVFIFLCMIFFISLHKYLPTLFLKRENLITYRIASKLIKIGAFIQLLAGLQAAAIGSLRGIQDINGPMYITFLSYWIVAIPLAWVLAIKRDMGVFGVWTALGIGLTISATLLIIRCFIKTKKLK